MKESGFQFSDPVISYVEFKTCENEDINNEKNNNIRTVFASSRESISPNEEKIQLKISIGEKDSTLFYINLIIEACFRWDESISKEKSLILLNSNAPMLLLSYARPIIANITGYSKINSFNIPFYNFSSQKIKVESKE